MKYTITRFEDTQKITDENGNWWITTLSYDLESLYKGKLIRNKDFKILETNNSI